MQELPKERFFRLLCLKEFRKGYYNALQLEVKISNQ